MLTPTSRPELSWPTVIFGLTVHGWRLLIARVLDQSRPVAHVVKELGCSRATGYQWLQRWRAEGYVGLRDRSPAGPIAASRRRRRQGSRRGSASYARNANSAPAGSDRCSCARLHRSRRADPPRPAPPGLARPAHRGTGPPLRTRPTRQDDPRRREETRTPTQRRGLGRPRPRQPGTTPRPLRPPRRRRLAYAEIHPDEKPIPAQVFSAAPPTASPPTASPPSNGS